MWNLDSQLPAPCYKVGSRPTVHNGSRSQHIPKSSARAQSCIRRAHISLDGQKMTGIRRDPHQSDNASSLLPHIYPSLMCGRSSTSVSSLLRAPLPSGLQEKVGGIRAGVCAWGVFSRHCVYDMHPHWNSGSIFGLGNWSSYRRGSGGSKVEHLAWAWTAPGRSEAQPVAWAEAGRYPFPSGANEVNVSSVSLGHPCPSWSIPEDFPKLTGLEMPLEESVYIVFL